MKRLTVTINVPAATAGSWGRKPLQTDGTSAEFSILLDKIAVIMAKAEKFAVKDLVRDSSNNNNLYSDAVGIVVFIMQHNMPLHPNVRKATLDWCAKQESGAHYKRFAEAVRKYKPVWRKDLGVEFMPDAFKKGFESIVETM